MIQFEEYKGKLNEIKPKLAGLGESLNLDAAKDELERLHAMQEAPGFWDDAEKSRNVVVRTKLLESKVEKYRKMCSEWDDLMTICDMALE